MAVIVELAPMAGITNAAYRQLCREQYELAGGTDGRFVCEMITSRGLVEGDPKTRAMLSFDPGETRHSVQLYGVDPEHMARATTILCDEYGVAHVDLNFGCPVPKVTRKGGGAALPWKRDRLRSILGATVEAAQPYGVPVTIKTRIGIDDDHQTYLDAGRIAEDAGCAAIALHGRTAQQAYSGQADWSTIAKLKEQVSIPVLRQRRHLGGGRRHGDDRPDRGRRRGHRARLSRSTLVVPRPRAGLRRPPRADAADAR